MAGDGPERLTPCGMRHAADLTEADWAAVEQDYREGILSLRTIERRHRVHFRSIYTRARAKGWPRRRARDGARVVARPGAEGKGAKGAGGVPHAGTPRRGSRAAAARRLHDRIYRAIERGLEEAERDGATPAAGRELIGLLEKLARVGERLASTRRRGGDGAPRSGTRPALDAAGRAAVNDFLARHGVVLHPVTGWGGRAAGTEPLAPERESEGASGSGRGVDSARPPSPSSA
jgi:hypothetical protein